MPWWWVGRLTLPRLSLVQATTAPGHGDFRGLPHLAMGACTPRGRDVWRPVECYDRQYSESTGRETAGHGAGDGREDM